MSDDENINLDSPGWPLRNWELSSISSTLIPIRILSTCYRVKGNEEGTSHETCSMQHIDDLGDDLELARGDVEPEVERLDELSAYLLAWIRRYELEWL
jgi:hypothetical protein